MTTKKDLEALKKLLDKPIPIDKAATVELADENDPEGTVLVKNAAGVVIMAMPREDYEAIREYKP